MAATRQKFFSEWRVFAALCCMADIGAAAQFGHFTYTDSGASITITRYPATEVGTVDIPASIVDKPVSSLGDYAFSCCSGLTSVTIPSGVASIGSYVESELLAVLPRFTSAAASCNLASTVRRVASPSASISQARRMASARLLLLVVQQTRLPSGNEYPRTLGL